MTALVTLITAPAILAAVFVVYVIARAAVARLGLPADAPPWPSAPGGERPAARTTDRRRPLAADWAPPRPLRVVHLITDLQVGGTEVVLARLVQRWDRASVDNTVIALRDGGALAGTIREGGTRVIVLGVRPRMLAGVRLIRLVALLRRLKPDVLQTWLYHADLTGIVAGCLAGVRTIVWNLRCAALDPRDHRLPLRLVLRLLAAVSRVPSAVVCNAHAGRRAHERLGYQPRRWAVIPNGFDTELFHPDAAARFELRRSLGVDSTTPIVGLLARFHPMKDHATFLRAARIVARERGDVLFVMAGLGIADNAALMRTVSQMGLTGCVRLFPEQAAAPRFLAGLDVAVSSSYSEGFPNVVGETMACGTPCVVTDAGDSARIVGGTGRVVPPRDPEPLARGSSTSSAWTRVREPHWAPWRATGSPPSSRSSA